MICDDVNRRLDALIDGELAAGERDEVVEHLRTCSACREDERRLRRVVEVARELPREIAPERDLWPAIAARIEADKVVVGGFGATRAVWRRGRAWLAAAALVVLAATVLVLAWRGRQPALHVASGNRPRIDLRLASLELDSVRSTYAKARQELLTLLSARRSELSPETVKVIEENVVIIDDAVEKIQAALAKDPGNRELNMLLVTAYRQEIDLLRQVVTLGSRA